MKLLEKLCICFVVLGILLIVGMTAFLVADRISMKSKTQSTEAVMTTEPEVVGYGADCNVRPIPCDTLNDAYITFGASAHLPLFLMLDDFSTCGLDTIGLVVVSVMKNRRMAIVKRLDAGDTLATYDWSGLETTTVSSGLVRKKQTDTTPESIYKKFLEPRYSCAGRTRQGNR